MEQKTFEEKGNIGYFRPAIGQTVMVEFLSEIYEMKLGEELEGLKATIGGTFALVNNEVEKRKELMYIHAVLGREITNIAMKKGFKSLVGLRFQATRKENVPLKGGRTLAQYEGVELLGQSESLKKEKVDKLGSVEGRLESAIEGVIEKHFKNVTIQDGPKVAAKLQEEWKDTFKNTDPMNLTYTILKTIDKYNKEKT